MRSLFFGSEGKQCKIIRITGCQLRMKKISSRYYQTTLSWLLLLLWWYYKQFMFLYFPHLHLLLLHFHAQPTTFISASIGCLRISFKKRNSWGGFLLFLPPLKSRFSGDSFLLCRTDSQPSLLFSRLHFFVCSLCSLSIFDTIWIMVETRAIITIVVNFIIISKAI